MKRLLAVLLAMILLASSVTAALGEADSGAEFETTMTSAGTAPFSDSDLFISSHLRALLTVLLITDMQAANDSVSPDDVNLHESYVGKEGSNLYVFVSTYSTGDYYAMIYQPDTASASRLEDVPADQISAVLEEVCTDGFYANDEKSMLFVLQLLMGGIA